MQLYFKLVIFKLKSRIDIFSIPCEIALRLVNISSGNDLVPSDNKPLPEPMLTKLYVTIWRH